MSSSRLFLLAMLLSLAPAGFCAGPVWHDVRLDSANLDLEGKAFTTGATYYSRVPTVYSGYPFYALSGNTSGFAARFATNSLNLSVRWSLTSASLSLITNGGSGVYYGPSGVSGISVYQKIAGIWTETGAGTPDKQDSNLATIVLQDTGSKECMVYFPLYNGITQIEIGVDSGASFGKAAARPAAKKPMVFYGTSITQGACASRPGWTTCAVVGQKLDWPVIDLGFSGSGMMEIAAAEMISAIDASVYVIDCIWNVGSSIGSLTGPFVAKIRETRPNTPIVLVDATDKDGVSPTVNGLLLKHAQDSIVTATADSNLIFLARDFIGDDGLGVTDGVHLSDTGWSRQNRVYVPFMDSLLNGVGPGPVTIQTESAMRDKDNNIIRDCQQPHIAKFGDKWYAYGFDRHGLVPAPNNTLCYSSTDLRTWTLEDTLFTYPADNVINGNVIYNAKNNEYVFIGQIYGSVATVYTGPTPTGPFTYRNAMTNTAGGVADYTVFADTNGLAYLIYNRYSGSIPERFAYIYQLNDDYYDIIPSTFCNTNTVMEGFWMARHNGNYFLFGSGLVGCGVDDNFYITAPSPLGPWTYRGYFVPPGSNTFNSQTFMGLQVTGSKGTANVFIGQRDNCTLNGRSIWLPLVFNSDTTVQTLQWVDAWTLDTAGEVGFVAESSQTIHWVDNLDPAVSFTGSWFTESYSSCYAGNESYSNVTGDYVEFGFRGTSVSWLGTLYTNRGKADVFIDGVLDSSGVDLYGSLAYQHVHYFKNWADQDTHTIKIVVNGAKNTSSSGTYLSVDAFTYTSKDMSTPVTLNAAASESAIMTIFPNPFNPQCGISVSLKEKGHVKLGIYNMAGQLVREFKTRDIVWDGRGFDGKPVSAGVYLCRLVAGSKTITRKMVLAR